METIDVAKASPELYRATAKVTKVSAGEASFIAVDGHGAPGGEAFQKAMEALFNVVFTLKFTLKAAGTVDFKVSKPETLYFDDPQKVRDINDWHWRLLIRVPDEITEAQVEAARMAVREKKGIDASPVSLIRWTEGRCLQTLSLGPYDNVAGAYRRLGEEAERLGIELTAPAHEIYLNDPGRTAPERLKTIVRLSIAA
jgi:hypothetical protein